MTPDAIRAIVGADPRSTALLFDFDGTLAPIVEDPERAAPESGALELLARLAVLYRRVAVVSGRPRSFLAPLVPESVDLSALYGLESRVGGTSSDHPDAQSWHAVIDRVAADAELPSGVLIEPKRFSLTAHFRRAPEAEAAVEAWAARVATETGLEARTAKASIELHPPLGVDKGTAVRSLAKGCRTVVYVGDDVGDLPAFAMLDELQAEGVATVKIASAGAGLPEEMAQAADLVVPDPAAVVALFAPLV
ncbi:trehalose-phosphatase [Actinospongicola halichondriae]|uniref:trehalose-phosphatase n=1 Tax=Actinospongicola halichondriae TaxID=3236844 RepID=UPI003D576668